MRIVIDGYNLIRRVPELRALDREDLEAGRETLVRELSAYRAGKGHRITVVFDGAESLHLGGGSERVAGISVRYSPRGRSADSIIREMCREGKAEVVVTGDREIVDTAKRWGTTAVSPELFWDRVQEEMYRKLKGEEEEEEQEEGKRGKGEKGRKLSKELRRDRGWIEKL
ncbi:MAG: NYN domain-containing protein [bacterium]|nr:MAG: NYN domain-containing protein [bacterium]